MALRALAALPSAARAMETAYRAQGCSQLQQIVSVQSLGSTRRVQGLPQPASVSSVSLKQRRMPTVCMAHPRRVAMVTRQIERDVGMLFSSDPIILSAISPEYAFGCELMTCMAWVSRVELTSNLQCARIYFNVYGDQRGKQIAIGNLKAREKYVRMKIAQSINLRRAPEVRMIYDDSAEREEMTNKRIALVEERRRLKEEARANHRLMKMRMKAALDEAYEQALRKATASKQDEGSGKQETASSIGRKQEENESFSEDETGNTIESKQDTTEDDLSDQTSDSQEDSDESEEQDSTEDDLSGQTSYSEEDSDESEEQDLTEDDLSGQTSDSQEDSDESEEQDSTEDDLSGQTSYSEEDSDESEEQDSTEDDLSGQTSDSEEDSDESDSTDDTEEDSDETDSTETSDSSSDSEEDVLQQR